MAVIIQCLEAISKVGLGVGAFALLTWMVINNTNRFNLGLDKNSKAIENTVEIINKLSESIDNNTNGQKSYMTFVKTEHLAQMAIITTMTEKNTEDHLKVSNSLDEVTKGLGRVNGYKT